MATVTSSVRTSGVPFWNASCSMFRSVSVPSGPATPATASETVTTPPTVVTV